MFSSSLQQLQNKDSSRRNVIRRAMTGLRQNY
jgi:hypothetical protein